MGLSLSIRREWVVQSEIRNMSIECQRVDGINLSQGVCDTEVPEAVRRGAQEAIDGGVNTYTRYDGLIALRRAIAEKQKRFAGMTVDPEGEIIVSAGATGALYCTCLALLNPGDEVILFEPFYGYHVSTLVATQAVPVYVRLSEPEWSFTEEALERAVTARTKAILLNSPANPSGKVFTLAEMEMISNVAIQHDLFVFTDEIYEHFVYDGRRHMALVMLPGMRERTITISGLSKTFSITGWRIGYCLCDEKWAQTIGYFNDLVYVCAPAPLQMGVACGLLNLPADYCADIAKDYEIKRDIICRTLSETGLTPCIPAGAYYVLADLSRLPGATGREKAMFLLHRTGVAAVPGDAFYHREGGEKLARFCFAKENAILEEACLRLKRLV